MNITSITFCKPEIDYEGNGIVKAAVA